jgi:glycine/D-amino acid oxidase-like deaminating enzyme
MVSPMEESYPSGISCLGAGHFSARHNSVNLRSREPPLSASSRKGQLWGIPPWVIEFQPPPRPLPASVDFAVIGGGFSGLSAAAWLRRMAPEKGVVVLEAERLGAGASSRTGGMALAESAAGNLPGLDDVLGGFAEILRELEIECELSRPGAWELGRSGGRADSPIDWNDHGNLRAVREVAGGTVNPGELVSGLARAAVRAGATIHEYARVESLTVEDAAAARPIMLNVALGDAASADGGARTGGYDVSDTSAAPGGAGDRGVPPHDGARRVQLLAQRVLLATNAQSLEISGLSREAHPKLTLAVATAPLSAERIAAIGLSDGKPFYTVDFPYLWGRVLPSRGVIFGAGLVSVNDWRELAEIDVAAGEAAEMIARIEQRIRGLHPALHSVEFTHRWGGPILFEDDMRPVFRWLQQGSRATEDGRALVLGAYAGHGVALSVYLGRWAAQALLNRREPPPW